MMRSLYSGVSGLKVHQTKMDVIGNNVSNVNTVGFKSSSVNFSDALYQTMQSASGANASTGKAGQNAMQIGLGTNIASITTSITQSGGAQRTDIATDLMITGDAFFIVNNGGQNFFTKAGAFKIDGAGNLATESGAKVMGWQVDPEDETKTISTAVSPLTVMSADKLYSAPESTTKAHIVGNIDSMDTQLESAAGIPTQFSFYDKMGNSYTVRLKVDRNDEADAAKNEYRVSVTDVLDSDGNSVFVNKLVDPDSGAVTYEQSMRVTEINMGEISFTPEEVNPETGKVKMNQDFVALKFDVGTGAFVTVGDEESTKAIDFKMVSDTAGDSDPFSTVSLDFSGITQYATSGSSSLQGYRGAADGSFAGRKVGNMVGLSIDNSGKIYGKYDNDSTKLLGQIAVASFANPSGLESMGNSMFAATKNSGDFDGIGQDATKGGGKLTSGVLEMSNVDLATEFTQMITTQRGFQSNSRIITTSDSLLEELINLKR